MDTRVKSFIWGQFGAAIDTLENAITTCPEDLWGDRSRQPEYWYVAYHTLFWLDYYTSESHENFRPPSPFGLEEMDPAGVLPPRVYAKDELLTYLEYGREKSRAAIASLTDEKAWEQYNFGKVSLPIVELHLYSMRHLQHHAAQLNLILRQVKDTGSKWVFRSKTPLGL
jgi:hypothetical protein